MSEKKLVGTLTLPLFPIVLGGLAARGVTVLLRGNTPQTRLPKTEPRQ